MSSSIRGLLTSLVHRYIRMGKYRGLVLAWLVVLAGTIGRSSYRIFIGRFDVVLLCSRDEPLNRMVSLECSAPLT